jgi:hypothetical protein
MADKTQGPVVYTALIMPLSSASAPPRPSPGPTPPSGGQPGGQPPRPDHTLPGELPHPEHPIFFPLPPGAPVHPDQGLPGEQPHPEHPIAMPPAGSTPPTGTPPKPDHTLPGDLPQPSHPIVLPPDTEGGWGPIYIWGGGPGARPPIAVPPDSTAPPEAPGKVAWKAVWTPDNGWQTIGVIVPSAPVPTPSKK